MEIKFIKMQFNSNATNQDIVSEIYSLCDADSTSYPINAVTRRVNVAYEELIGLILTADGTWQWDDTNYTISYISLIIFIYNI